MKLNFSGRTKALRDIANKFDLESARIKLSLLRQLADSKLPLSKALVDYLDVLLFIRAFPGDPEQLRLAERESSRVATFLKASGSKSGKVFRNSGLPFTGHTSSFSHDFISWLMQHPDCKIELNRIENSLFNLNDVLKHTLPSLEKSETTADYSNEDLLESLFVKKNMRLPFLVNEFNRLNETPFIKDHFFEGLGIYIDLIPRNRNFSRAFNRISFAKDYFHNEILRKFDQTQLLESKIFEAKLTEKQRKEIIRVVKTAKALTDRETDPVTYMEEDSLRYYELERGISVAIFGMIPQRQLPLESYVGYTLFKNGFPTAYGGGWVFGESANFGINIFEAFRGGESGYIMCQLLRVYRQAFNVSYIEVEAYQYGLDNPDGITSGAFWFYYRHGFRPLDKQLLKIANEEFKKITQNKNYRTSRKTLISFTNSNIALNLKGKTPVKVYDITYKVREMIYKRYQGHRQNAENDCISKLVKATRFGGTLNQDEQPVLKEVALWAAAMNVKDSKKLHLLIQMVKTKPVDLYAYQNLVLDFFRA